jgi:hypothetical protein
LCNDRKKLSLLNDAAESFYERRVTQDELPKYIAKVLNRKKETTNIYQTKCFPSVELKGNDRSFPSQFALAKPLVSDTAFHRETLDRLGLLKPRDLYTNAGYFGTSPSD